MKKLSRHFIYFVLFLSLILFPITMAYASASGIAVVQGHASMSHCDMTGEGQHPHQIDSLETTANGIFAISGCMCDQDCQHQSCSSNCTDCSHCVIALLPSVMFNSVSHEGVIVRLSVFPHNVGLFSEYRPPRQLQS